MYRRRTKTYRRYYKEKEGGSRSRNRGNGEIGGTETEGAETEGAERQ